MHKLLSWFVAASAASVLFFAAEKAQAGDFAIGADVGVAVPFDVHGILGSASDATPGAGYAVDGLLGYRLRLGPLWLQPEAVAGVRHFDPVTMGRVTGGARFGLGGLIQPQVYAHLGGAFGDNASGFTVDGGGALDLKISVVFVGVHGGIGVTTQSLGSVDWVDVGGHFGLLL